jgi:hypothetical protein
MNENDLSWLVGVRILEEYRYYLKTVSLSFLCFRNWGRQEGIFLKY